MHVPCVLLGIRAFLRLIDHILFKIFIFCPNSTLISRENCRFFWVKNSWKCCGLGLFSCWQLWFYEKNCQKIFRWKTCENVGFFFVKIEFLYKNLTFIIVCLAGFSESLVNSDSDSDSMTPYEEYVIYFLCRFHQSWTFCQTLCIYEGDRRARECDIFSSSSFFPSCLLLFRLFYRQFSLFPFFFTPQ